MCPVQRLGPQIWTVRFPGTLPLTLGIYRHLKRMRVNRDQASSPEVVKSGELDH